MKIRLPVVGFLAALALFNQPLSAASVTYVLPDIGTFTDYSTANIGQTYSGDGFVGLYNTVAAGEEQFVHLFGLEVTDYSRTAIQTNISALAGSTVTSATLSFDILDGSGNTQSVQISSYLGDGSLGYDWSVAAVNSGLFNVGGGSNALDVTALVSSHVAAGDVWLGLHLMGSSEYLWTYTDSGNSPDRANVRLTIEYTGNGVPDATSTAGILAIGLAALVGLRRRFC